MCVDHQSDSEAKFLLEESRRCPRKSYSIFCHYGEQTLVLFTSQRQRAAHQTVFHSTEAVMESAIKHEPVLGGYETFVVWSFKLQASSGKFKLPRVVVKHYHLVLVLLRVNIILEARTPRGESCDLSLEVNV